MDPSEIKQNLAQRILTSRMVWAALMGSVLIYLCLGYVLPQMGGFKPPENPPPDVIAKVLTALGIMEAVAGVLLAMGKLPFPKIDHNDSPDSAAGKVFSAMIISWALCESAAIMGLVMFFLYGSFQDLLIMAAVAVAGLVFAFPTEGKYMDAIRKTGGPENMY